MYLILVKKVSCHHIKIKGHTNRTFGVLYTKTELNELSYICFMSNTSLSAMHIFKGMSMSTWEYS